MDWFLPLPHGWDEPTKQGGTGGVVLYRGVNGLGL